MLLSQCQLWDSGSLLSHCQYNSTFSSIVRQWIIDVGILLLWDSGLLMSVYFLLWYSGPLSRYTSKVLLWNSGSLMSLVSILLLWGSRPLMSVYFHCGTVDHCCQYTSVVGRQYFNCNFLSFRSLHQKKKSSQNQDVSKQNFHWIPSSWFCEHRHSSCCSLPQQA